MIGFAGLGKYLNERGLALLKGRKQRLPQEKRQDLRVSSTNKTNYSDVINWYKKRRSHSSRTRILVFILVLTLSTILAVLLLM